MEVGQDTVDIPEMANQTIISRYFLPIIGTMDRLDAMAVFAAIADGGSLSAAGRRLRMPLASVSRKLADLEAALGTRLMTRTTRQLTLTEAGREYLVACRDILERVEEAERTVQQFLRTGLAGRFSWCSIRAEQPAKLGRTDIEVVDDRTGAPGAITHHALLELKVLRSFAHTGLPYPDSNAIDAVSKGVNQAHAYGLTHNTLLRMLCCFDMRTIDVGDSATFAHAMTDATALRVRLRRWYMYRSSALYRDAIANRRAAAANKASAPDASGSSARPS